MAIKFKIYTLGCKVNQYDSGKLAQMLLAAGFNLAASNADIAIINTCSVTKVAIGKNKRMINKAKKKNPKAKIILMGCWPQVARNEAKKLGADFVYGVGETEKIVKRIKNLSGFARSHEAREFISLREISRRERIKNKIKNLKIKKFFACSERARYFIKIQDGCEQFCSYCIIPFTRGKLQSKPEKEVISEIKETIEAGYQEIVLCGIHLGQYGQENLSSQPPLPACAGRLIRRRGVGGEVNLVNLLKKLIKIKNLGRIRLSSIEVTEVSDQLIKLMANLKKICRHLHIPLQSGSDKILKLMNRPYDKKYFENKIRKIKKLMPDIAITTDVIVGFPGETLKEFRETYNFIKKIKFSRLHVFPFSSHAKTAAAKIDDKIDENEIKFRAQKLRKLGRELSLNYKNKFLGKKLSLIVERKIDEDKYIGKSEFYFDLEFNAKKIINKQLFENDNKNLTGKIVEVKY